ncbi:hypothetical protein M5689_016912 [Euphorbia peplus]|nr:hypothetical protein M5689_016912 [Euphorbia peplus]
MEEITRPSSSSPSPENRKPKTAVEKECLSFLVSVQESFQYIKAKFVGLGKKVTARSEEEAMAADLQASKIEVQAADEAERAKSTIFKS